MTQTLAEVLSGINDPHTIKTILTVAGVDDIPDDELATSSKSPSLNELYNRFLDRRKNRSPATQSQYKRTIPVFIEYVKNNEISQPSSISHELVDGYIDDLEDRYETDATVLTHTKNVRTWLVWLNQRDFVGSSLYKLLNKEELGLSPEARDEAIHANEAEYILNQLRNKRYGSPLHTLMELLWNSGPRLGGVHSLDIRDFDPDHAELRFRHRPETDTRLKNGCKDDQTPGDGERNITISDEVISAIQYYIQYERPDVNDEFGRAPLFATQYGRASRSTLRRWVYEATSCRWAKEVPEQTTCDGTCDPDSSVCPHSYYPHALRRGAIVHHLSNGLRPDRASERFDVSTEIIRKHYDPRTKLERREDRANAVRNAW